MDRSKVSLSKGFGPRIPFLTSSGNILDLTLKSQKDLDFPWDLYPLLPSPRQRTGVGVYYHDSRKGPRVDTACVRNRSPSGAVSKTETVSDGRPEHYCTMERV